MSNVLDQEIPSIFNAPLKFRDCYAFRHYARCRDDGGSHAEICVVNDWDGELADRLKRGYRELGQESAQRRKPGRPKKS